MFISKLDKQHSKPQYVQLYEHIKHEMVTGGLAEHTRMPSIRSLADFLGVSPTTVESAYSQLQAEGYLVSKPKRGYYVQPLGDLELNIVRDKGGGAPVDITKRAASRAYPARDGASYQYDFHLSQNDFALFPFQLWRKMSNQALRPENQHLLFYGDPQGEYGLRVQISRYLHRFRGCQCTPDQIVVGSDQHHLLTLLSSLLKLPVQHIGVENPGYLLHAETFKQNGFQVSAIPLEADGICIGELVSRQVQAVCVSPSHQYPRGMTIPIGKRIQLLEWSRQAGGYIIEDDYDGEFRYHGRAVPALQGLVTDANVIYLGGFSQVLAPALCVHYMVLPASLIDAYQRLEYYTLLEQSSSRLHQYTLQLFMEGGHLERHIRKMRKWYGQKHDLVIETIQRVFAGKAQIIGKDAGFHILLRIDHTKTEQELVVLAKQADIRIASAAYTWLEPPQHTHKEFLLGFGGIKLEQIVEGVERLYEVWYGE
ncbi:PLP-dependent aminotransferase family protein [Paenibacillus sp. UMB4589-SE434]|uniref:MocR-like pyridoxine biosynthesis transcription factor PdxR n=1 Tax=Paenibacillus sp. UMB4589-SE434 TaxID=3046314 RepID=UPI00254B8237|nr:PLP-dependent aminotransferase family protein [Paenibacillus sp. UMB4589-SE434]MDK8182615.1 PLP-dependent aminotransferase family protein [Paenibacillus sp. UMB4589-SE434]